MDLLKISDKEQAVELWEEMKSKIFSKPFDQIKSNELVNYLLLCLILESKFRLPIISIGTYDPDYYLEKFEKLILKANEIDFKTFTKKLNYDEVKVLIEILEMRVRSLQVYNDNDLIEKGEVNEQFILSMFSRFSQDLIK